MQIHPIDSYDDPFEEVADDDQGFLFEFAVTKPRPVREGIWITREALAIRPDVADIYERARTWSIRLDPDLADCRLEVHVGLRGAGGLRGRMRGWRVFVWIAPGDPEDDIAATVAHELRHVGQWIRGELDGLLFASDPGYWTHPSEVDARAFADRVCAELGL